MSYNDEPLPLPEFISINNIAALISMSSANFYRNANNSNVLVNIPAGTATNNISVSSDVFLPEQIFNNKMETISVKYSNNTDVFIMREVTCQHNISLQFKLNKSDGTNFANQREVRITLVDIWGNTYNQGIFANYQPSTGVHTTAVLIGSIIQTIGDVVKIKFNLVQDNKHNDTSDTLLTIFNVSWNIEILKNF